MSYTGENAKPTCRGSYFLGSACGMCARCEEERPRYEAKQAQKQAPEEPQQHTHNVTVEMHTSRLEFLVNQVYDLFKKNGLSPVEGAFVCTVALDDMKKRFNVVLGEVKFNEEKPAQPV